MNTENFEEEIDILKLVKHLLSKWKIMLFAGLCFALLGFGYKYYKFEYSKIPLEEVDKLFEIERVKSNGAKELIKVNYNLYVENYQAQLSQYDSELQAQVNRKRLLESDIAKIKELVETEELYSKESILNNMDPNNFTKLSKTIMIFNKPKHGAEGYDKKTVGKEEASSSKEQVDTANGEKDKSSETNLSVNTEGALVETPIDSRFVNLLVEYMRSKALSDKVAKLLNKKKEKIDNYITELYGFTVNGNSITFFAQSDSEKLSKSILSLLEKELTNKLSEILTSKISYSVVDADSYFGYSSWIFNKQIDDKNRLIDLKNQVEEKTRMLSREVTPVKPDVLVDNPDGPVSIEKYKLKKLINFAIAGFAFGVFALSGLYALLYLFPSRIRDKLVFTRNLGIRTLSAFSSENDEINKKVLSEELEVHAKGMKNITVVTTLDNTKFDNCIKILENILKTKNISSKVVNKNAVSDIAKSDAVIFLEKIDFSKTNNVLEEIDTVQDLKKEILGFVYF